MQATRNGIHFKSAAEAEANEFPVALMVGSSLHAPGFALQKLTEDTQVFLFFDFGQCLPATRVGNVFKSEACMILMRPHWLYLNCPVRNTG